jgi:hypothetical protein
MARKRHTAEEIVAKLRQVDVLMAQLQITEAAKSCPKAHRRSRRRCDMEVSAAPAQARSQAAE